MDPKGDAVGSIDPNTCFIDWEEGSSGSSSWTISSVFSIGDSSSNDDWMTGGLEMTSRLDLLDDGLVGVSSLPTDSISFSSKLVSPDRIFLLKVKSTASSLLSSLGSWIEMIGDREDNRLEDISSLGLMTGGGGGTVVVSGLGRDRVRGGREKWVGDEGVSFLSWEEDEAIDMRESRVLLFIVDEVEDWLGDSKWLMGLLLKVFLVKNFWSRGSFLRRESWEYEM